MALQGCYISERGGATIKATTANPVLERFSDLGLCVREESEGRLYPQANKAASVLDVLRSAAAELGVDVQTDKLASRVDAPAPGGAGCFNIRFADKTIAHAAAVIVAVGGRAAASGTLGVLGHATRVGAFARRCAKREAHTAAQQHPRTRDCASRARRAAYRKRAR